MTRRGASHASHASHVAQPFVPATRFLCYPNRVVPSPSREKTCVYFPHLLDDSLYPIVPKPTFPRHILRRASLILESWARMLVFFSNGERRLLMNARLQRNVAGFTLRDRMSPAARRSHRRCRLERIVREAVLVDVSRPLRVSGRFRLGAACLVLSVAEVPVDRARDGQIGGNDAQEELEV